MKKRAMNMAAEITPEEIDAFQQALRPLIGVQFELLKIPQGILAGFEPSQIGTIVGTLMDACIPQLAEILPDHALLAHLGLSKYGRILGDREGYPDFEHTSGKRAELKLLYVDPVGVTMKRPPTPREPSARLTQKVTVKNVQPVTDVLLVIAYQLQPHQADPLLYSPTIIDLGIFSMISCIQARDARLLAGGGQWFGNYDTPAVLSKQGLRKRIRGELIDRSTYGRKEAEKKDLNEDTNFGKLSRIPYPPLRDFLRKHGYKMPQERQVRIGGQAILTYEEVETSDESSGEFMQGSFHFDDSSNAR
jgi:hypothetical protein